MQPTPGNALISTEALIALIGYFPCVFALFAFLAPRRAVIWSFLIGWLFLPQATVTLIGLPELDRVTAPGTAVIACVILFDVRRFGGLRPSRWDLPVLAFCIIPFATSIERGYGAYDGMSGSIKNGLEYGLPYLIGRLYFRDLAALRELALALFIGGLVYVPFCLVELRLSPQFHRWVYDYSSTPNFGHVMRYGGFRPTVFLKGGVMLGLWMSLSTMIGAGVVWNRRVLLGMPTAALMVAMVVTTVLTKAIGAITLLTAGLACMLMIRTSRTWLPLVVLLAVSPVFLGLRLSGVVESEQIAGRAATVFDSSRIRSLSYRLQNEDRLIEATRSTALLGAGRAAMRIVDENTGKPTTITDSAWIIQYRALGILGLSAFFLASVLPVTRLLRGVRVSHALRPTVAPVLGLAIGMTLYSIDCLVNYMIAPILPLAWGAFSRNTGWAVKRRSSRQSDGDTASGPTAAHRRPQRALRKSC